VWTLSELINTAKANDGAVASSIVLAGQGVQSAWKNIADKSKEACVELISEAFREDREGETPLCVLTNVTDGYRQNRVWDF
jgi:hypothetical protein